MYYIHYKHIRKCILLSVRLIPKSLLWKEQRRDHKIGNQFPWLVSSVFERRPRRCVPVTWREVHGHQVLTADTLTIEAKASDPRACATGTALNLLASVAFRWNLNVAPSGWLEQVQKPRRHRQEQDQNKAFSCRRLTGSHWELNTLTFVLRCGQKNFCHCECFSSFLFLFSHFKSACRSPQEECWNLSLSFNPQRRDVRTAVWEPPRFHQGVIWRRRVEAGEGESRRQAALLRHPPGTLVLWQTAVLLNRHCFSIKTLLQSSTSKRVYPHCVWAGVQRECDTPYCQGSQRSDRDPLQWADELLGRLLPGLCWKIRIWQNSQGERKKSHDWNCWCSLLLVTLLWINYLENP